MPVDIFWQIGFYKYFPNSKSNIRRKFGNCSVCHLPIFLNPSWRSPTVDGQFPYLSVTSFLQHLCPLCEDFIFLRPQGPVWPPHRAGRKYQGVNTPGAILNNGGESGWINTPAVWPLVPDNTEVCSTRPLRESLGISFQLLTLATHSPMHCFLAFFPSLFHFPTPLLVLPGIISKHTTCTQILVLGVRRTQTMQEQSGRSLLPRERQLTFILSFYSSLSLSLSLSLYIYIYIYTFFHLEVTS